MRRRLAAFLLAASAFSGCSSGVGLSADVRQGGSIIVGVSTFPASLDPSVATDPRALQVLSTVHTPLITYRHEDGKEGAELVPGLARAMPVVSDDGLSYTMRLRRGIRYSDGTTVTVGDFERAVERVRATHSPLTRLYEPIRSIATDARTLTIRVSLKWRDPSFPKVLALSSSAPLPRGSTTVGVGPYRLARVDAGRRAVLVRVRGFHLPEVPAGHVDRITLSKAGSPARIAQGVITGSLDVMEDPAPVDLLPEIRSKYRDRYREDATASAVALIPDWRSAPLDDPAVRRAVGESLDRDKLVALYAGFLEPTCNLLPEALPGYSPIDPCPYGDLHGPPNLVDAKLQVDKAGAAGASLDVRPDPDFSGAVARYVTRTLRKIGLAARTHVSGAPGVRLERIAPVVPHAGAFLERFATTPDPQLSEALVEALAAGKQGDATDDAWAAADDRVVKQGYAIPFGVERRATFLSERLDAANCERVDPLHGLDLSSLCLK